MMVTAHGKTNRWQHWPEVLRFGKIVRDAFVHNGRVTFTSKNPPLTTWRRLAYDKSQENRQVLYGDLPLADVVFLRRRWLWVVVLVAFVVLIAALLAWTW
jgi:hypothetical protein